MKELSKTVDIHKQQLLSVLKFGYWSSLIIGSLYIGLLVFLSIDPTSSYSGDEFYKILRDNAFIPFAWRYVYMAIGFLTLFWINALTKRVREVVFEWEGPYKWIIIVGYAGAIMTIVDWSREVFLFKQMTLWSSGDSMYRIATEVSTITVDPNFLWRFGGLGLWYFVTCLLAKRARIFDNTSNLLGMGVGIGLIISMILSTVDITLHIGDMNMTLMKITTLISGILAVIYHIRMFFVMKKDTKELVM